MCVVKDGRMNNTLTSNEVVPAVLAALTAKCPNDGFDHAAIAGSFAAREAAIRRGHGDAACMMMWNDVDVYYSAPGGETTRGITTEDSELVFLESGYAHVDIGEHTVEINFVRLSPFTLQTLVEDFDINAVCAGFDIFPERQEYESAAFDDWISDRVLRPVKVQSPARLCVRMAYKSMQLECPAEYDGMDPTDGEMAGEAYPKKLAALRAADFPEPRCFRGLSLWRRTEDGVFENTGEPRVFYHFERDDSEIADAGGGRTNPSEVVAGHVTRWGDVA